ncbi:hypothetical protein FACS1894184_16650 [Clostridia bacterium]|nr:hypothetical protein FACS1894184_16650 [Clostridia bacterium]
MPSKIALYTADCIGNSKNAFYPNKIDVSSVHDLHQAATHDHVCAVYKNNRRSKKGFIQSNCVVMDCDNDNPSDWITPTILQNQLSDVEFYASYSRNHMKPKNDQTARPRFHVYFPIDTISDENQYSIVKRKWQELIPVFDTNAIDSGRFMFGVSDNIEPEHFEGSINIADYLNYLPLKADIPVGKRNATLSNRAGKIIKRFGDTGQARSMFDEEAGKCDSPLSTSELNTIWNSAQVFFHDVIEKQDDYIIPEDYVTIDFNTPLMPHDWTDVGQAKVLAREYSKMLRYSTATKYLFYTSTVWVDNELRARKLVHMLTERQLDEANKMLKDTNKSVNEADKGDDKELQELANTDLEFDKKYHSFVLGHRKTERISATLKEAQSIVEIEVNRLDSDPFKLNTPSGVVDLRTGEMQDHDPLDYCTKICTVSPNNLGEEMFADFLKVITCSDDSLIDYLQLIAGMSAIGVVYAENLVIAYGSGHNGKRTFFNLLGKVLGDYKGSLSAETLTVNCRKNKSPEYAELRGRCLAIAAELEEGMRLDTAIVKKLCSTDPIYAEKKYKDPFSFTPSHSVVLYTNHLPRVGTTDAGTWRRLIVVSFNAVITGNDAVLDYCEELYNKAGGTVLSWIIKGAQCFIQANYKISSPECVVQAIEKYRKDNDWLNNYLADRCVIGKNYRQKSGNLYMITVNTARRWGSTRAVRKTSKPLWKLPDLPSSEQKMEWFSPDFS